jgi:hypothetical protein
VGPFFLAIFALRWLNVFASAFVLLKGDRRGSVLIRLQASKAPGGRGKVHHVAAPQGSRGEVHLLFSSGVKGSLERTGADAFPPWSAVFAVPSPERDRSSRYIAPSLFSPRVATLDLQRDRDQFLTSSFLHPTSVTSTDLKVIPSHPEWFSLIANNLSFSCASSSRTSVRSRSLQLYCWS